MAIVAIAGLVFLGSGLAGNRMLRLSTLTNDPVEALDLRNRAGNHLMVKDTAELETAMLFANYAEYSGKRSDFSKAVTKIHKYFFKEPQSRELKILISAYSFLGERQQAEELATYLKPGSFSFEGNHLLFHTEENTTSGTK